MDKKETECGAQQHTQQPRGGIICPVSEPHRRVKINLLDLPNEILQLIAWHMDAPTFYISLLTCKKIKDLADCRRNILRHIESLPGTRLGLDPLSTTELLLFFRKKAAESLCGAGVLANVHKYGTTANLTKSSKAVFSPGTSLGKPHLLATLQDFATVNVYELTARKVRLKSELRPRFETDGLSDDIEVIRIAFSINQDLAILYRVQTPAKKQKPSPFVDELAERDSQILRLVTFHRLHARMKGHFYSSHVYETRDIVCDISVEPVGLAIASNLNACIAYSSQEVKLGTEIMLVGRNDRMMEDSNYDPSPRVSVIWNPSNGRARVDNELRAFNVQFIREYKTLNFYKPGNPVHSFFTNSCDPASHDHDISSLENRELIDVDKEGSYLRFAVGMPFVGYHTGNISVDYSPFFVCRFVYLAIGITQDIVTSNVFVVQASFEFLHSQCLHTVDLEKGRRNAGWKALALLAGWRQSTNSANTVMAISPKGGRIAAANWAQILVWTFDPMLLHQGSLEHYFPAFDYNAKKEVGRLRPTLLSMEAVVHSMVWADEKVLYAFTDRGLIKWDMGHRSAGERMEAAVN